MAGGRFLSRDDPTISPDARVRASVGVGNDCEPYVDPLIGLSYPIAPPGVVLPSCFALDNTRGEPGVEAILERVYAGATAQVKVEAIAQLERLALERFAARALSMSMPAINPLTGVAFTPMELSFIDRCNADPVNCRALIAANTGGSMSSPFNSFLGGPTMSSLPFGFSLPSLTPGPIGFLPQLGDALGGALPQLATIAAQFFANQQAAKAQEDALKRQLELARLLAMGGGSMALGFTNRDPLGDILGGMQQGGQQQGPVWTGAGQTTIGGPFLPSGSCGPRGAVSVSPGDAPGIYKQGCSGALSTRARFFALRSDGTRDLFVKVGKVQSVSPRTLNRFARRWAKEAGLTASKRGAGRGRGRRRPR